MKRGRFWWVLMAMTFLAACGGGALDTHVAGDPTPSPPDPDSGSDPKVFNVTFTTPGGLIYVDKLELEFGSRRGIHGFYGFFEDRYESMKLVSFNDLDRIDFLGPMSPALFDQAIEGRENLGLRISQAFETRLTYKDQTTARFYAIISRFRGEKDFRLWERDMSNNALGVEYIEFNR